MREIKFQIYWIEGHEMLYDTNNDLEFRDNENYWITDLSDAINQPERYKVRQYTGLKDKYGVEIYEGDIVISQDGTGGLVYKHIVEWNEFYKRFEPMGEDEAHFNRESCEIIGNRFENPELLEAKE